MPHRGTTTRYPGSDDGVTVPASCGFLPAADPLARLPRELSEWDELAGEIPKLLVAGALRSAVDEMSPRRALPLRTPSDLNRAMLVLSYLGHAYIWGETKPADRIPRGLAVPWRQVAQKLGRPPILSYASYALANWRRVDPKGSVALGNIVLLQNFLGGVDEEWFVLVHVEIEARAGAALAAIQPAQKAVKANNPAEVERQLAVIAVALDRMSATLLRMPEHCDPYIYYNRVRPYLYGWKNQPALPEGLIYEGVKAYGGKPQMFRGETGAQSTIIPSLDAALGIHHQQDVFHEYLMEMRHYMPPGHRGFLEAVERGPSVREYAIKRRRSHPGLRDAYNRCIQGVQVFRDKHLEYASAYIQQQSQKHHANPNEIGTGGTPFMPYLGKHLEETAAHLIE